MGKKVISGFIARVLFLFLLIVCFCSCQRKDKLKQDEDTLIAHPINMLHVGEAVSSVAIDGFLDEEVWSESVKLAPFVKTAGEPGDSAQYKTECYAAFDKQHLYLAFVCEEPEIDGLKANAAFRDDPDIIFDDRVSVFIDPTHDHRNYYELSVNPSGIQFDQKVFRRYPYTRTNDCDLSWNGVWKAKTRVIDNRWIAEIQIDVKSLDVEELSEGVTWGFNVARARKPAIRKGDDYRNKKPVNGAEYSAWTKVNDGLWETVSNFHEPIEFGDLIFGKDGLVVKSIDFKDADFRMGQRTIPSTFGWNPIEIKFNGEKLHNASVTLWLILESDKKKVWMHELEMNLSKGSVVRANYFVQNNKENKLTVEFIDNDSGKSVFRTSYVLTVPPFIDFNLASLYLKNMPEVKPVLYRMVSDPLTCAQSELTIKVIHKRSNNLVDSITISDLKNSEEFHPVFDARKLRALQGGNYLLDCTLTDKASGQIVGNFVQPFTKFELKNSESFEVVEEDYCYGGLSGHSARIVYPSGAQFVFWEKANYIPWWDIDQAVLSYEFVEAWGSDYQGCCEPMQDRECRYSSIEVLEKSPARVVVHWRYALNDAHYKIYKGEWVDEYYRFYPDGIGIREVDLWANSTDKHEFLEAILVNPPALETSDMLDKPYAHMSYLDGKGFSISDFQKNGGEFFHEFIRKGEDFVFELNFKDRLNPFFVFSLRDTLLPDVNPEGVAVGSFNYEGTNHRQHWPASLYAVDGYNGIGNDRPTHGALGNIHISKVDSVNNPNKYTVLIGVKEDDSGLAAFHGQSWLYPAQIEPTGDLKYVGYDSNQRAYILDCGNSQEDIHFNFVPQKNNILNPIFIVKNKKGIDFSVLINEEKLDNDKAISGDTEDGARIVFINQHIQGKVFFTIKAK